MRRVKTEIRQARRCTDAEIAAFCCFVRQGDEVDPRGLEGRVRQRGKALVFLYVDNVLVGVGALKKPDKRYRDDVFLSAGVPKESSAFDLELGWVSVPEEHRGRHYSRVLSVAAMTQADGAATFATTRADNPAMQRTLEHLGFRDRKSTRLNSSHLVISYAVFCLKKKTNTSC